MKRPFAMSNPIRVTSALLRQPGFSGLLVAAFTLGVGFSFVSPFLSLWGTQEIGLSPLAFGLFLTATTLSAILVTTTLARWSDSHVPRKVMLVVGAVGGALGYTGYALVHDPRILLAIGVTLLALASLCFSQVFAYTRERYHGVEIEGLAPGLLVSVVRVCFSLAWTAGPTVGAWVMVHAGFRGLFLGAATLFAVFLVLVLVFVPLEPRPARAPGHRPPPLREALRQPGLAGVFAAFGLIFAAHTLNVMNLPLTITRLLGGTERDVGIAFGVGPVVEIPLMLWFGALAARGHTLRLLRIGAASTVAYFLLLALAREPWHVFPLQFLHGLSFAIISNVAILFFQDLLPGQAGLGTTLFTNAANLGNLLGYFAFGTLLVPLGNRGLFLVSAALTAVTLAMLLAYRPRTSGG